MNPTPLDSERDVHEATGPRAGRLVCWGSRRYAGTIAATRAPLPRHGERATRLVGVMAVGKRLKPGHWESAAATAERLKTTSDDVRRRLARHELTGFQVRPHGRWYVTSK
jgi:hypothetical protein